MSRARCGPERSHGPGFSAVLTLLVVASTLLGPPEALAVPPGVYWLGGEGSLRFANGRPELRRNDRLYGLLEGGASAFLNKGSSGLRYQRPDGTVVEVNDDLIPSLDPGTPPGADVLFRIEEISRDGSLFAGTQEWTDPTTGEDRARRVVQPIDGPAVEFPYPLANPNLLEPQRHNALSSNGELALGFSSEIEPGVGLTGRSAIAWSASRGFISYARPAGRDYATPYFVANDGTAVGTSHSEANTLNGLIVSPDPSDGVIVWSADGSAELLGPVTREGGSEWSALIPRALSANGEHVVASTGGISRVFSRGGDGWEVTSGNLSLPIASFISGVADDGSLVVGQADDSGCLPPCLGPRASIWSREDGQMDFSTYLQLAGIDTTGWEFESIIDVSPDGRTFVGYGYNSETFDYLFYAVVPEPSTALLLGLGLTALASSGRRHA